MSCFALGILAITVALLQGQPAPTGHFIPFVWPTSPPDATPDQLFNAGEQAIRKIIGQSLVEECEISEREII